jgi:prevent-host-death family protein
MVMKTVSAREANQQFSRLLGQVVEGEEIVITRRGQPVATLAPYRGRPITAERQAAIERLMALLDKGFPMGGIRATRDEMHER